MDTIFSRWSGALGFAVLSIVASFYAPATLASATWQEVRSTAPMLGLATDGHTYVAAAFNGLWRSSDLKSWQKVSLPAHAGSTYRDVIWDGSQFIAVGAGIVASGDGTTWVVKVEPADSALWSAVAVAGGIYVVVGEDGAHVERSTDGAHWHSVATGLSAPSPFHYSLSGIGSNGSGFVTMGEEASVTADGSTVPQQDVVATSPDGLAWTLGTLPSGGGTTSGTNDAGFQDVAWGAGTYVAGGFGGVYTSPDGITWNFVDPSVGTRHPLMNRLAYLHGTFIGVGVDNDNGSGGERHAAVFTSADGTSWSIDDLELKGASSAGAAAVTYTGSKYVEAGELGVYTSTDATTWTKVYTGPQSYLGGCVISSGSGFALPGSYGTLSSADGVTWSSTFSKSGTQPISDLYGNGCGAFGAGVYVTAAEAVYWSKDGKSWTPGSLFANGVAWNGTGFAAVVSNGSTFGADAYTSSDGKTWTRSGAILDPGTTVSFGTGGVVSTGLSFLNKNWVAWGLDNDVPFVAISSDAAHWTVSTSGLPGTDVLVAVAYGSGRYVAIGNDASGEIQIFTSDDAKKWTRVQGLKSGTDARWQTLIYGNAEFLAGGTDNATGSAAFLRSADGKSWTYSTDVDTSGIYSIDWDGSAYTATSLYDILRYVPSASSSGGSGGGSGGGGTSGGGGGTFGLLCLMALAGLLPGRRSRS